MATPFVRRGKVCGARVPIRNALRRVYYWRARFSSEITVHADRRSSGGVRVLIIPFAGEFRSGENHRGAFNGDDVQLAAVFYHRSNNRDTVVDRNNRAIRTSAESCWTERPHNGSCFRCGGSWECTRVAACPSHEKLIRVSTTAIPFWRVLTLGKHLDFR